jgi:hypothetical protein
MEVVVQGVRTSWTKRSRGEPVAARRNAAPAAFPLPPVQPPFVHEVLMGEHDGFQPHFTVHEGLPGTGPDCGVLLNEADSLLQVQLAVTPFGMPEGGG